MKKIAAFIALAAFSIILLGNSSNSFENSKYSKSALTNCPYLNQIHLNAESAEKTTDGTKCPYIKSQKSKIEKNDACPFQEKQKQIYYEMNKKRAEQKIKLS
ncbi:MAG: hypothetical protein HND52_02860 [Ignavibacteriae bacterium]|nr:hypothetical protein [Ignavibacteriota bacterium]NOG96892.1 hypothetical protein [Ignavibacteriota bacterium]